MLVKYESYYMRDVMDIVVYRLHALLAMSIYTTHMSVVHGLLIRYIYSYLHCICYILV